MTPNQRDVLAYMTAYAAEHGVTPVYTEIAEEFGLLSKNGVHRIVHALADQGFLRRAPGAKARPWRIVPQVTVEEIAEALIHRLGTLDLPRASLRAAIVEVIAGKLPSLPRSLQTAAIVNLPRAK